MSLFTWPRLEEKPVNGFARIMAQNAWNQPRMCLLGVSSKKWSPHPTSLQILKILHYPSIHLRRLFSHSELEVVCDTLDHSAWFLIIRWSLSTVSQHKSRSSCLTYVRRLACPLSILQALPSHKTRCFTGWPSHRQQWPAKVRRCSRIWCIAEGILP